MLTVTRTTQFKRDFKLISKRGYDTELLFFSAVTATEHVSRAVTADAHNHEMIKKMNARVIEIRDGKLMEVKNF